MLPQIVPFFSPIASGVVNNGQPNITNGNGSGGGELMEKFQKQKQTVVVEINKNRPPSTASSGQSAQQQQPNNIYHQQPLDRPIDPKNSQSIPSTAEDNVSNEFITNLIIAVAFHLIT